jgi:hypothetical protein
MNEIERERRIMKYLLGELPAVDESAFEEELFFGTEEEYSYIDALRAEVIDMYAQHKLSSAQEEHVGRFMLEGDLEHARRFASMLQRPTSNKQPETLRAPSIVQIPSKRLETKRIRKHFLVGILVAATLILALAIILVARVNRKPNMVVAYRPAPPNLPPSKTPINPEEKVYYAPPLTSGTVRSSGAQLVILPPGVAVIRLELLTQEPITVLSDWSVTLQESQSGGDDRAIQIRNIELAHTIKTKLQVFVSSTEVRDGNYVVTLKRSSFKHKGEIPIYYVFAISRSTLRNQNRK